jgi:MarR-like DNA-binding transcriptional regulator SgrR of sgrS sRNA
MASRGNGAWTVLKRNPYYRGSRRPPLDAIVIREGLDAEKAVSEVEQRKWQGLALTDRLVLPGSALARRHAAGGTSLTYRTVPEERLSYLALNANHGPLHLAALRRRIAASLDRAVLAANDDLAPTDRLLPPALGNGWSATPARPTAVRSRSVTLRMAIESDCSVCQQLADLVAAQLRREGISITSVPVANVAAAMRATNNRIDLAALSTELPYPDPASFLAKMLGQDIPQQWLPRSTRTAVAKVNRLSGQQRARVAVTLSQRLATTDVPLVAYGIQQIGVLLRPQLGCRRWDSFNSELDLTALCLTGR